MRVLPSTPSLRARSMQKHRDWAGELVPVLRAVGRLDETEARALVLSALFRFDAALEEWVGHDGARPLGEILDRAFRAVGWPTRAQQAFPRPVRPVAARRGSAA